MKRDLQKMIALVAILLLPFALFSQEYGRVLTESFEDGIPQEWLQEKMSGDVNWIVENGGVRPNGAFEGDKRLVFRNTSGKTTKAKTRLVLPQVDISSLYQPILIFAHAQDKWTDDFDTLKILYRTSADANWTELKVYDKYIAKWTVDTVRLIAANKTYQIAFEATDNLGRGIVLDDIEVRSTPNCLEPYSFMISNLSNDSATLGWLGAFDAESFSLKVSTTKITNEQLADDTFKADVLDIEVKDTWEYTIKGLSPGVKYYYYMRSNCENENSNWVCDSIQTSNFLQLPYFYGFDHQSTPGFVTRPSNWYFGATSDILPYVNSNYTGSLQYQMSVDSSFVLCFCGNNNSNGNEPISGGQYAYAALPAVNIESVSDLEVSFYTIRWSKCTSCPDLFSIIVGVMTDPENKASFVPVDTVAVTDLRLLQHHVVSLENYKGEGKFIAFMSDFLEDNLFRMDNLKVDYRSKVSVVDFDIEIPSATSIKLDFHQKYDKYEVMITASRIDANREFVASPIVLKEVVNLEEITNLPAASDIFVYARAIKGADKGNWSLFKHVRMPAKISNYPYLVDFEIDESDPATCYKPWYGSFAYGTSTYLPNDVTHKSEGYDEVPESYDIYFKSSSTANLKSRTPYELTMTGYIQYEGSYCAAIFPELKDVKNTRVGFWACKHSSSPTSMSAFAIGMMSDANDISTFEPIDTIYPEFKHSYYIYDLDTYKGSGKFFDDMGYPEDLDGSNNYVYVYVDDVQFSEIPMCRNPYNVEVKLDNVEPSKVRLSWDANGATAWTVRVSDVEYDRDSLNNPGNQFVYNEKVTSASAEIKDLEYPGKQYYYWIKAECETSVSEWSVSNSFKTDCSNPHVLPYIEDFDKAWYSTSTSTPGFTVPCMMAEQVTYSYSSSTTYYPYLSTYQKASGDKSMLFTKSSSWYPKGKNLYVAMPLMAEDVNKLQISFKMYSSDKEQIISVGVMTDPFDSTTFEHVAYVEPTGTMDWLDYIIPLDSYKGEGKYIALMTSDKWKMSSSSAYIDDIVIDKINPCKRPENVSILEISTDSLKLKWTSDANKAKVLVSTERLSLPHLNNPAVCDTIAYVNVANENPFVIEGLQPNTAYYVYVQAICSDNETSAWTSPLAFRTNCSVLNTYELGVERFDSYGTGNGKYPPCYIVGNKVEGATVATIPQCSSSWKHSGGASLLFNTTTKYNAAYAITPEIDITDISMLRLKLWGSADKNIGSTYAKSLVVGIITDPLDLSTFYPIDTLEFSSESIPYEVLFDEYKSDAQGKQGNRVMFLSEFALANKVYIDDVVFDTIPTCRATFEVVSTTENSATIAFTSDKTSYQLKYATELVEEDVLNGDALSIIEITKDTFVLNGLDYNTTYYLYARPNCGGSYGEWTNAVVVTTECPTMLSLPFVDDFEKNPVTGSKINPACWNTFYKATDNTYPQVHATANEGIRGVYVYAAKGYPSYLVSQKVDVDNLNKCQVSFYAKPNVASKDRAVIIGVVSDIEKIATTFTPIDTIILNEAVVKYSKHIVSLDKYVGDGKYIAFASDYVLNANAAGGFYFDDVRIELIPSCAKPDFFEPKNITDKSMKFAFAHEGALKYEVKYGAKGFAVETAGTSKEFTTKEFTLEGLTAETVYDIYVRAYCSETEMSPWQFVGTYKTIVAPVVNYPYEFDFSDATETALWRFAQDDQPNQWFIGTDDDNVVNNGENNGGKALYISMDGGATANYREKADEDGVAATSHSFVYRPISLEAGIYTISYDWTCRGEANSDYIRVGLLPITSKFESGVNTIKSIDGSSVSFTHTVATQPTGWIELSEEVYYSSTTNYYKLNLVDTTVALVDQWKNMEQVIEVSKEMAGVYNLFIYWKNDASNTSANGYYSERGAVIDNISIIKEKCNKPINVEFITCDHKSVDLKWDNIAEIPGAYEVLFAYEEVDPDTAKAEQIALVKTFTINNVHVDGLTGGTKYYTYIRSVCSEADKSMWTEPIEFVTLCDPMPAEHLFDFDDETEHFLPIYEDGTAASTTYMRPNCFVVTHDTMPFTSTYAAAHPYLIKNTSTSRYSRSGDYALFMNRTNKTTHPGGTIAMPAVDGNLEKMQLTFWMRAVYETISTSKMNVTNIGTTYARKVTVGTMTDPNDPTTFVALDTIEYPYPNKSITTSNYITDDPNGNGYWVEVTLPLTGAKGKYVAFKNEIYGTETNNKLYIDDIVIASASCITPSNIAISSITSSSVKLDAIHGDAQQYEIALATNEELTENLRYDTVSSLPAEIKGLTPATRYYVQIRSLCSVEETSKWSIVTDFTTSTVISYHQTFSNASYCPADWSRASSPSLEDRFETQAAFSKLDFTAVSSTWSSEPALFETGLFSTRHISSTIITTNKGWLFTPVIEMPENEKLHLVFDLALTAKGANTPVVDDDKLLQDDKFAVIVSEDGGATWTKENAIIWGHEATDEYKLFDIPNVGERIDLDLTKYAGKTIQIAFYVESTQSSNGAQIEIHLDNVHINSYEEVPLVTTICQTEDYEDDIFEVSSYDLVVGENKFSELVLSNEKGVSDVYHTLSLVVTPMVTTNLTETICEGDVYAQNNFSQLTEPGVYKQKLPSACGCDSVVILNLSVTEVVKNMVFDTICYGNSVEWNGQMYDRTGVYSDTLVSVSTGCDSIVTLVLNVRDAIRTEAYQNICFGESYQFGSQTITATGDYTETFQTATGCDSIVTLHATVLPDYRRTLNVTIFEGEIYNENGFVGLSESGEYTLPLKSTVGDCDSTITLNLKVIDPTEVAIGNVNTVDLILVPNPIESGNTLFVNAEFTKEQSEGLLVEVFNAIGQKVYGDKPYVYPIEINGLTQRGVYLVRITAGNGKVYQGKVVVK